jgi:hypothetical protein
MKEEKNVTKYIHIVSFFYNSSLLHVLLQNVFDDALLFLMRSMPTSYRIFVNSLWQQDNFTLKLLIIDLMQKKYLRKD